MTGKSGTVILLNGTSSSGKTTLAKELQKASSEANLYASLDIFLDGLPGNYLGNQEDPLRAFQNLVTAFSASNAAIARAGINVIIDHVLERPTWVAPCVREFESVEVVFVAVRCSLEVLEAREKARGDRHLGLARGQYDNVHSHGTYDVEVDTSKMTVEECVRSIRDFVESGKHPTAFEKLRALTEV